MDIDAAIKNLREAPEPSRYRDVEIAQLFGWTEDFEPHPNDKEKTKSFWRNPDGEPAKVPHYTSDLGVAHDLALKVAPDDKSGCSWEDGMASARIGAGPYVQSTTPEIALCLAVLMHMQYHQTHLPR